MSKTHAAERLSSIFALDVAANGSTRDLTEDWPSVSGDGAYRWLHLDFADESTERWLAERLPDFVAKTLCQPETRPRCVVHGNGVLLNLRGVNLNEGRHAEDMVSIRIWLAGDLIVSVRVQKVFALDEMHQRAQAQDAPRSVSAWIAALTEGLLDRIESVTVTLDDQTDELEDSVLTETAGLAEKIGPLRRAAVKLRRFLGPQRDALARLAAIKAEMLDEDARRAVEEAANRAIRAVEELDAAKYRLDAVQDHLTAKQAEVLDRNSYVLSVIAAIFLPLGFLTGLLGVNVAGIPGADWPPAFWTLCAIMVIVGVGLFYLLRRYRWL